MRVPHQGSLGAKNSRLVLWETALEKSQRREAGGWCGPAMEGPGSPGDGGSLDPPPKPSAPHRCPKPRGCAEVGCSPPAGSSWKRSSGICLGWERGFQTAGAGKTPRGGPSLASAVFQLVTAKNVTARPLSQKKNNSRSHVYSFCSWTEAVSLRLFRILAPGLAIGPHAGMHGDGTQTSALLPWTRGCCSQMWCPRGAGPAASTLLGS